MSKVFVSGDTPLSSILISNNSTSDIFPLLPQVKVIVLKVIVSIATPDFNISARHGNTGQNFLTRPDLKNTWPEPDFFYPKLKQVDPWPDLIFLRANLTWPKQPVTRPVKKIRYFFLIMSWYYVHKAQSTKTSNNILYIQCLSQQLRKASVLLWQ